jgi:glycosyltransferase involved in cell wall biosynthesis
MPEAHETITTDVTLPAAAPAAASPTRRRILFGLKEHTPESLKVIFRLSDFEACGWYRGMQPANAINTLFPARVNQTCSSYLCQADIDKTSAEYVKWDVIVHQRQHYKNGLAKAREIEDVSGSVQVYETDDDITKIHPSSSSYSKFPREVQRQTFEFISEMDYMTTTTEPLKKFYSKWHKDITVIPNAVDMDIIKSLDPGPRPGGEIVIGWAGGGTHYIDLQVVIPVIKDLMQKYKNLVFQAGGWINCPLLADLPAAQLRLIPWEHDMQEYYKSLKRVDIGIAPLADTEFNMAKSNLRYLEFSACGVPVVASDVYPYANSIKHGTSGLIVKASGATYKHWYRALETMINDAGLRQKLAQCAQQYVNAKFNQKDVAEKWVKFYERVCGRK